MNRESGNLLSEIAVRWRRQGLRANRGASTEDIEAICRRYDIVLPESMIRYAELVNGMLPSEYDEDWFRLWPLQERGPVHAKWPGYESSAHRGMFLFADWSINAHGYAVRLERGEAASISRVGGAAPTCVAESFDAFLRLYVDDPKVLLAAPE